MAIAACPPELNTLAVKLLDVPEDLIASALEMELAAQTVTADSVAGTPCVFLSGLYRAERAVAGHLRRVTGGPLPWPKIDAAKALPWAEARTGLTLADSQAEAVRLALRSKATVITGGPGVGKTTIVKTILRILQAKAVTLLLCAPTGRAAKRMSEATGMEAKTIHRLLEVDPKTFGFRPPRGQPAHVRPARGGRKLDGRCPADASAAASRARSCRPAARRRH